MERKERRSVDALNEADSTPNSASVNASQNPSTLEPKVRKRRTLSAGVIPVFLGDAGPIYLLLRAYSYWDFPKGGAQANEEPLAAAIREMREETSIEEVDFPWGYGFQETPPYSRGKVARYYIGRVHTMNVSIVANPESGQIEHHEFRWVTFAQAVKLVSERVLPILQWAHATIDME